MKLLIYLSIGLTIANTILQASEFRLLDRSFLTILRAEAVAHHPTAIAASLRASAASSGVCAVRLWDDPTMGLALMAAESEKRHSDGDIRIGWEQALPKRGLFVAKEAKASAAQRAEFDNWQNSRIEIGAAAARDAIELALTDESIAIQSEPIAWQVTMVGDAKQSALAASMVVSSLRVEFTVRASQLGSRVVGNASRELILPPPAAPLGKSQPLSVHSQVLSVTHQTLSANSQALSVNSQALSANSQALSANSQTLSANSQTLSAHSQELSETPQVLSAPDPSLSDTFPFLSIDSSFLSVI